MIVLDDGGPIRATFAPEHGASLCSLAWRRKGRWQELLHRANQFDAVAGWRGQAPWLWPAVGRNYTDEQLDSATTRPDQCRYRVGETTYPIPIHGFAMDSVWQVQSRTATGVTCTFSDNAHTRTHYPFGFTVQMKGVLTPTGVRMALTVKHVSDEATDSESRIPFSIGNHLTIRQPLPDSATDAVSRLFGEATWLYEVSPFGLEGKREPLSLEQGVPLDAPWCSNAILGGFTEPSAGMVLEGADYRVRVVQTAYDRNRHGLTPDDYRYVLYMAPTREFFCLEPWLGSPNSLNTKRGVVRLAAGQTFRWEMEILLEDRTTVPAHTT